MTEQNKPKIDLPSSEKSSKKSISRRDFIKLVLLGGGGLTLLSLSLNKAIRALQSVGYLVPERDIPAAPISPEEVSEMQAVTPPAGQTSPTEMPPQATREPVLQREGVFANIDLFDSSTPIDMGVVFSDQTIIPVPPFTTVRFHEGILESGEFAPYKNTVIVWRDGGGRIQLDGHSGWYNRDDGRIGFTFTPWQIALEETSRGIRLSPDEVDNNILTQHVGKDVLIRQGSTQSLVKIMAGVRVPPRLIRDSKTNIADIVPWLSKTFPNHGFEEVLAEDPWKVSIIKFCGRNLVGENLDTARQLSGEESPFRQARFFFALKAV